MTDNERIAKVIWSNSLQRSIQFFGWLPKLTSIKVIENGTSFYLGKLKAWVSIQYERSVNNFSVIVRPDDGGNEIVYHSVSLDNLVPVIDANVISVKSADLLREWQYNRYWFYTNWRISENQKTLVFSFLFVKLTSVPKTRRPSNLRNLC